MEINGWEVSEQPTEKIGEWEVTKQPTEKKDGWEVTLPPTPALTSPNVGIPQQPPVPDLSWSPPSASAGSPYVGESVKRAGTNMAPVPLEQDNSLKELFFGTKYRAQLAEAAAARPEQPMSSTQPAPSKGTPILRVEDTRPFALKALGVSSPEEWADIQQRLKEDPVAQAAQAGQVLAGFPVALTLMGPVVGSLIQKLGAIPKVGEWLVKNETTLVPAIKNAIEGAGAGIAVKDHEQTVAEAGLGGAVLNAAFGVIMKEMPSKLRKETEAAIKNDGKPAVEGIVGKHEIVAHSADDGLPIVKMLKEVKEETAVPEFKAPEAKPPEVKLPEANPAPSSLEQEALKYPSAEEFVKAQGEPVYHGTPTGGFTKFDPEKMGTVAGTSRGGFSFTNKRSIAEDYAKSFNGRAIESARTANEAEAGLNKQARAILEKQYGDLTASYDASLIDDADMFQEQLLDMAKRIKTVDPKAAGLYEKAAGQAIQEASPEVIEAYLPKNQKQYSATRETLGDVAAKIHLKDGETATINLPNGEKIHYASPSTIKTKSDLISIWNKAHAAKPAAPPIEPPAVAPDALSAPKEEPLPAEPLKTPPVSESIQFGEYPIYYYRDADIVDKFTDVSDFVRAVKKARSSFSSDSKLNRISDMNIEKEFASIENYYNWAKNNMPNIKKVVKKYELFVDRLPVDNATKKRWKNDPENLELNIDSSKERISNPPPAPEIPQVTMASLKKDPKQAKYVLENPDAHTPELVKEAGVVYRPDHQWRIGEGLKAVTEKRAQQEASYSRERGVRLNKGLEEATRIRAAGGTEEEAYKEQLKALKGDMTKVEYEAFKGQTSQDDFNLAFKDITNSPKLTEWEKITAKRGFRKMWEGKTGEMPQDNEIALLKEVFPADMIDSILKNRTTLEKFRDAGYQVANLPRALMSSFDFSFGLRQGIFVAARHPVMFAKAEKGAFKAMFSEKDYQAMQEAIRMDPRTNLAKEAGLALTDLKASLANREEAFMANWAEKVPGVRASARHYTTMANKLRFDLFNSLVESAKAAGRDPAGDMQVAKQIAEYVNNATGRGSKLFGVVDIGRQAKMLNSIFFSPRLMASRTTLMNPLGYIKADPVVRKEYLQSLGAMASSTLTILGAAKLAEAEIGTDPRSSDFMKIIIGNTRVDIMGGFQQYLRAAGQLISGEYVSSVTGKKLTLGEGYKPISRYDILLRQVEAKEAPVLSLLTSWLKQQDPQGRPVSLPKEIANRFIPMVIADAVELYKDTPEMLPLVILGAAGVGLQTYEPRKTKFGDAPWKMETPKFKRPWENK